MRNLTVLPLEVVRVEEATPLSPADMIAIHELLNRVYLSEDSRDREALHQVVTENFVQIHSVFGQVEGRKQFADWVISNPQLFDSFRHQAINTVTRSTGVNTAQATSYILVFQIFSNDAQVVQQLPRLIGHGVATDSLAKEDGYWRLEKRVYDRFSLLPSQIPDADLRTQGSRTLEKK